MTAPEFYCTDCETMMPVDISGRGACGHGRMIRADLAAVQPAQVCPECSNTGLRDTGGVYPWGEGIFVACDHDDPQPDPRDEVIKGLAEAATDAAEAIDMAYGSDDDESPHRHSAKLRAALAAAKAVQHG